LGKAFRPFCQLECQGDFLLKKKIEGGGQSRVGLGIERLMVHKNERIGGRARAGGNYAWKGPHRDWIRGVVTTDRVNRLDGVTSPNLKKVPQKERGYSPRRKRKQWRESMQVSRKASVSGYHWQLSARERISIRNARGRKNLRGVAEILGEKKSEKEPLKARPGQRIYKEKGTRRVGNEQKRREGILPKKAKRKTKKGVR